MNTDLLLTLHGVEYECVCAESSLWFTQKALARIFGVSKANISLHTTKLSISDEANLSRKFAIIQIEGSRRIRRLVDHFDIRVLAAIALRARRYDLHEEILRVAADHKVPIAQVPIRSKREWSFAELLVGVLRGITPVLEQHQMGPYYVDFFLPELNLVVEYDEGHHSRPLQAARDALRQEHIEGVFGVSFIRINIGDEIQGVNEITRRVLSGEKQRFTANTQCCTTSLRVC
jgi:very-short-patch-repair endonuclease